MSDNLDRKLWQRFLDGDLDPEQIERMREQVAADPEVQRLLEELTDPPDGSRQIEIQATDDPAIERIIEQLARARPKDEPTFSRENQPQPSDIQFPGSPTADAPLGTLGPYNIQRTLGEGSSGLIFEAHDTRLDRTVAIKVLRSDLATHASARARFDREARAAAAIASDYIVTVYDVVAEPGFPPYLVMPFINGRSLREHLKRCGVFGPADAARIVHDVALGLESAHQHALVHRDIKPSNIMLDDDTGRAKIADFGLARPPRRSDLTRQGSIAGTPAYMSPEQITDPDRIDHRSDLYSLGAVMYELLTGEQPFRGVTRMVLLQVLNDEPRPPRKLNDRIPRDLENICLMAMEKDPWRRYATAADMADDLDRWRNGRSVTARPIGRLSRLWRWASHHVAVAALAVAVSLLLITIAAGSTIAAWRIAKQRRIATEARRVAEAHAEEAAHQRDLAIQTLNAMVFDVQDQLSDEPGVLPLKEKLLDTALSGLRRVARDSASPDIDSAALYSAVHGHWRMGDTLRKMGRSAAALDQYKQAAAEAQVLVDHDPTSREARRSLADAHDKVATAYAVTGDLQAARQSHDQSLTILREIVAESPNNLALHLKLAVSLVEFGELCVSLSDIDAAKRMMNESDEVMRNMPPDEKSNLETIRAHITGFDMLADLAEQIGDMAAMSRYTDESIESQLRLPAETAVDAPEAITAQIDRGVDALLEGRHFMAKQRFDKAVSAARTAVDADPRSMTARRQLVETLGTIAMHWLDESKPSRAVILLKEAVDEAEYLAKVDPDNVDEQMRYGSALEDLADAYWDALKLSQSRKAGEQALTIFRAQAAADPNNTDAAAAQSSTLSMLIDLCLELDDVGAAREYADEAITVDRRQFDLTPNAIDAQINYIIAMQQRGETESEIGDAKQAEHWYEQVQKHLDALGDAKSLPGDIQKEILDIRYRIARDRSDYVEMANVGRLGLYFDRDPDMLYNAACAFAQAMVIAPEDASERKTYREEALKALSASVRAGFIDVDWLDDDEDLDPIRDESRFRELRRSITE